jgi:hypothetical protein
VSSLPINVRPDDTTRARLAFVAASRGLEPSRFARLAVEKSVKDALAEMVAEMAAKPPPRDGRPRNAAAPSPPLSRPQNVASLWLRRRVGD